MTKRTPLFIHASILALASRQTVDGIEHLVIPAVAAKEGVMNGMFYSSDELKAFAVAWNGVPVPVGHPTKDGSFITANSPDVEETWNIGRVYNVNFDEASSSLKVEIWINIDKATRLGHADLVTQLEAGKSMDVSTGLFSNAIEEEGVFNGVSYTRKATGIRPDHLALLPNQRGACSVSEGCGTHIYTNCADAQKDGVCPCKVKLNQKPKGIFENAFLGIKKALGFQANEASHDQIRESLRACLKASGVVGPDSWPYIMDVYDKYFVYELDLLLYKQGYAMDATDTAMLVGERDQVMIKREYVAVNSPTTNNKTEHTMKPRIITLLATMLAANSISAEQEAAIKGLPDAALDQLFPDPPAPPANVMPIAANAASVLTNAERELLNRLQANEDKRVAQLRAHVKANYPKLDDQVIAGMDVNALDALAQVATPGVDFSLAAGAPAPQVNTEEAPAPPSILTKVG